jgi:hypothetical protein
MTAGGAGDVKRALQKKDGGPKPAVQYHVAVESAVDQNFAERLTNT